MPLRIANGAGFLGDSLGAPRRLVENAEVDYLTLEYLAELTMSILARSKEKDPRAGYAKDFIDVLRDLSPALRQQPQLRIVTNAGGVNPLACAAAAGKVLAEAGLGQERVGVVSGDDLLPQLASLAAAGALFDAESGEAVKTLRQEPYTSANAYLGAAPIVEALAQNARIVITGRVADASLTVGPAMHHYGKAWNDWNALAAFSVAGHLIECGAQVTGGYSTDWRQYDLTHIGYPIAEVEADGTTVITKPAGSGGAVNRRTVIEQLTYEIGDPAHYLTPDVDVDFTTVHVIDEGSDRVSVSGATGRPAPPTYKVSAAYRDGTRTMASGELLVYGDDAREKAAVCAQLIRNELDPSTELHVEQLGGGSQIMLRMTAMGDAERFARELASLITRGPAGLAGYAAGRPAVRPLYRYQPLLVDKRHVSPQVEVREAAEWK